MSVSVYKNLIYHENIQTISIYAKDDRTNDGTNCLTIQKNLGEIRVERKHEDFSIETGIPIKGLIGMLKFPQGIIIIAIKECTLVEVLLGHEIYKLNSVATFCSLSPLFSSSEIGTLKRFANIIKDYFENTPQFYFSYTFNLSTSLQKQSNIDKSTSPYLFSQCIPKFVWNYSLLKELDNVIKTEQFFLPLLHGCNFVVIGHCNIETNNGACQFFLISRRSTERAGTRFFKRGANGEGGVANFVESEHIFITSTEVMSYVQIRGSIPLEWIQVPNLAYSPPINILNPTSSHLRFSSLIAHFNQLIYDYKDFIVVSLIDTKGREKKLGDAFNTGVQEYFKQHAPNKYLAFDFHRECKNMNWKALDRIIHHISNTLDQMNYYCCSKSTNSTVLYQTGVVRTNCIDCLDRTNVLQSMISKYILNRQMESLRIVPLNSQKMSYDLNNLWADNADYMSVQYSGTPALKTDFTRTGKRTFKGLLSDGYYSLKRYYLNNLHDGDRQDQIDLSQKRHPVFYDPTYYKNTRSSGYLIYIVLILNLLSSSIILKNIFFSDNILMERLKKISVWATVLFFGMFILRRNSHLFISIPQSYYFYKEKKKPH